ncbi:MAG: hypothetical protein WC651_02790 [Candidatus Gracilibacteria bacterium]|jgi:hypothetical protein
MSNENENKLEAKLLQIMEGQDAEVGLLSPSKPRKSQADKLVELVTDDNCILFRDQFDEPYASVRVKDHWETRKLNGKHFKRWLCGLFWKIHRKAASSTAMSSALNILESKAYFEGEKITLETRIAPRDNTIWYDLSNEKWQAIKIDSLGWEIVDHPPIIFRPHAHQRQQVIPAKGDGDAKALLPFVNLAKKEQGLLIMVYLIACFVPSIPHPIPILYGAQGASKTTLARKLRSLVDPSSVEVLSLPTDEKELVQQLSHHYFAFFDNISYMPDWVSDVLCRAVTGEGFSKRELYSNDEDVIYNFIRCIGLNGINIAAKKPDLLDRAILLKLERITKDKRKGEKEIWDKFEKMKPIILAGIFDVLSGAMKIRDSIRLSEVPRMVDFTIWGCAIAEALGSPQKDFLDAYYTNIGDQNDEAINENSVATAIMSFMEVENTWEGSSSFLLEELNTIAEKEKLDAKGSGWPKSASALSRRLNEVKTNLAEKGILLESKKISGGKRIITIQKQLQNIPVGTAEDVAQLFGGELIQDSSQSNAVPVLPDQNNGGGESGGISGLIS